MKIYTVVGARPNFIKIDPDLKQILVHTGQHYDYEMSQSFFEDLELDKPKYFLKCKNNLGSMFLKLEKLFAKDKPDMVLVFGDTMSSLAGALAAALQCIPVTHVEAGMRSHDLTQPEEINRVLIDRIAKVKLCANNQAAMNLLKEGIKDDVYVVGDPMFDAMGRFLPLPKGKDYRNYILVTLHRNFNADKEENLRNVISALHQSDEKFIFPCHPRTRKMLQKFKIKVPKNVKLLKPQPYSKMLQLISDAKKVVTDSGGVQREAFWMNVPIIILRKETEWTEIVSQNGGKLVGTDTEAIIDAIKNYKNSVNSPPVGGANKAIKEILFKYV